MTRILLVVVVFCALFSNWSWAQTNHNSLTLRNGVVISHVGANDSVAGQPPVDYSFPLDNNGATMDLVGGWTADDVAASPLPTLASKIRQAMQQVSLPVGTTWTVIKYTAASSTSCQGAVQINGTIYTAQNMSWWSPATNDPVVIAHEMALAIFTPCGLEFEDGFTSFPISEGQANAKASLAMAILANNGVTGFAPTSGLGMLQSKIEQDFFAAGGGRGFDSDNGADIFSIGALFEVFASKMGSLVPLDQLWTKITPSKTGQNIGDYIAAIDQAVGQVGGKWPSTWISLMPQYFTLSSSQRAALGWTAQTDPTNGLWLEAYVSGGLVPYYQNTINPYHLSVILRQRQGGNRTFAAGAHTCRYVIKNSNGTVVNDVTFTVNAIGGVDIYSGNQPNTPPPGVPLISKDGLYTTQAFLYDNGVASNILPGEFLVDSTGWSAGKLVVMSHGVKLDLAPGQSPYTLTYVDGTDIAAIGNLPSVYTEVTLTDGTVTRCFPWVPSAPNGTMVWNWFPFDNPKIPGVADAATFQPLSQISAGEWITLWTLGANHGDPNFVNPVNGNYPTTAGVNAWGSTQVVFSCGNVKLLGAMDYVAAGQVNVQVPPGLNCATVNVQLSVNGTLSNAWQVQLATATPTIFMVQADGYTVPAITFANSSVMVTPKQPAVHGDILSMWYTGCGTLSEPQQAGVPAPFDHLIYATDPSTLFVGASQAQILFNGLAPGFVGLCQMNFVVPGPPSQQTGGGVSSSSVSLTVGGNAANSVVLSVQ